MDNIACNVLSLSPAIIGIDTITVFPDPVWTITSSPSACLLSKVCNEGTNIIGFIDSDISVLL